MRVYSAPRSWGHRIAVGLAALLVCGAVGAQQAAAPVNVSAERFVADYVKAWNSGDVDALGRMWTADGELIDAQGLAVDRKALLANRLAKNASRRPVLSIGLDKVRLLDSNLAIVDGESTLAAPDGKIIQETRFAGVLVKQDGTWRIRMIRQISSTSRIPPPVDPLKDLAWMVGDWVGIGDGMRVNLSSQWDLGRRYLVSRFRYEPEHGDAYDAEVRAGWDSETHSIKSWYFDSRGVQSTTTWQKDGDHWLGAVRGTQSDGQPFTGTMAITPIDNDSYLRTMSHLKVDGKSMPNQELRVFRVPVESTD